jgi:hypothetical protein
MRYRIAIILSLVASTVFAQKTVIIKVVPITKAEFNKHLAVINLITKPVSNLKSRGIIRIKTAKKTIVLKDDGEFLQFEHVGNIKDSIVVIHELEPNTERYLFINIRTGVTSILVNKPIFFKDKKNFIALEGIGTDITQRIQVGELHGDTITTKMYIKLPIKPFISPSYIFWYDEHTIFIATNSPKFPDTKFYKVRF